MRFSTSVALAVVAASSVPALCAPFEAVVNSRDVSDLEARKVRHIGNKLEHANNIAGIADGLTGIATNIAGAVQQRSLKSLDPLKSLNSYHINECDVGCIQNKLFGLQNVARSYLEARKVRHIGNKLEHTNNVVGIADGLTGIATNIAGAAQQRRDLEARKVRHIGNKLEHANNIAGIADGLTGIATNVAGAVQQRSLKPPIHHFINECDTDCIQNRLFGWGQNVVSAAQQQRDFGAVPVERRSLEELD
ncbi:unnamed protein product [Somion occarium]|uniref:Uncharacterized protein n=1 Tax=Somion occarium TaxID=3059160 RepID=A0ABP1DK47_9APHY